MPSKWSQLPTPTASLLAVANKKAILAAAAPEGIIVASTQSIRDAFGGSQVENNVVTGFAPQVTLQTPRVSQVHFTSDENWLVISAETGGGLAVYDVAGLASNNTNPAFQISTEGNNIRTLAPNPSTENAHGLAVVLENGKLMIADLNAKNFSAGSSGPVLSDNVSCVSWSNKGKQLVAGLADGTAKQLTPDGSLKAQIPLPPQLQQAHYISSITWLSNNEFVVAYTPTQLEDGQSPESQWYWVLRTDKTTDFQFRKFPEPGLSPPFGRPRNPPHHFVARLQKFAPNLEDSLIVASGPSNDVCIAAKATQPLVSSAAPDLVNNQFVLASMEDDSRRAQMPTDENMEDTIPIGIALDLSSTEPVKRPIPGEDIDVSATPLPLLLILNHEGILSAWWFVYADSVRQKMAYSGLVVSAGQPQSAMTAPNAPSATAPPVGQSSAFANPQASFGVTSFGQAGGLGAGTSPWGSGGVSKPSFGQPTFGSPGSGGIAPSFGRPAFATPGSGMAAPTFGKPIFGTPGGAAPGAAAFGTPGGLGSGKSPWAAASSATGQLNQPTASPFGAMAGSQSAFSSLGANKSSESPFGSSVAGQKSVFASNSNSAPPLSNGPSFGSTVTIGSSLPSGGSFEASSDKSAFQIPSLSASSSHKPINGDDDMMDDSQSPKKAVTQSGEQNKPASTLFGLGNGGFKLNENKNEKPATDNETTKTSSSTFGFGFSSALDETSKQHSTAVPEPPQTQKPLAPTISNDAGDAPLPPDPTTNKKLYDEAKKLDIPSMGKPILKPVEKTPDHSAEASKTLPESPKEAKHELPESPAGSSPVDLGASASSNLSSAPPSEGDKEKEKEKETSKRTSQTSPTRIPKPTPLRDGPAWSFPKASTGRSPPKSPQQKSPRLAAKSPEPQKTPAASKSLFASDTPSFTPPTAAKPYALLSGEGITPSKPATAQSVFSPLGQKSSAAPSHSPAPPAPESDITKPPELFSRPAEPSTATSPRSPSPLRAQRSSAAQSGSHVRPGSHATFPRTSSPSRPSVVPSHTFQPPPTTTSTSQVSTSQRPLNQTTLDLYQGQEQDEEDEDEFKSPTKEEEIYHDDDTDLQVASELASKVEFTRDLPPFIAEQNYQMYLKMPQGIPKEVERLYRDLSSMVDVLGLNARSLAGFVGFHENGVKDAGREWRDDLVPDKIRQWTLAEIEDLAVCQRSLEQHLETERLGEPKQRIAELSQLLREASKLRARHADTHRLLALHNGEGQDAERAAQAGLTAEQKATLHDLRKKYAKVQVNLKEAEDSVALLSAKLAAVESTDGASKATPTVEAILNTINKMTKMAESRRNEVDLLERKMRGLGFVRRSVDEDDLGLSRMSLNSRSSPGSARSSRYGTPRTPRSSTPRGTGTFTLEFSDDEDDEPGSTQRHSLRASRSPSTGREGPEFLHSFDEDRLKEWRAKKERYSNAMGILRAKVIERYDQDASPDLDS